MTKGHCVLKADGTKGVGKMFSWLGTIFILTVIFMHSNSAEKAVLRFESQEKGYS